MHIVQYLIRPSKKFPLVINDVEYHQLLEKSYPGSDTQLILYGSSLFIVSFCLCVSWEKKIVLSIFSFNFIILCKRYWAYNDDTWIGYSFEVDFEYFLLLEFYWTVINIELNFMMLSMLTITQLNANYQGQQLSNAFVFDVTTTYWYYISWCVLKRFLRYTFCI